MADVLEFIFSDVWHFIGVCTLMMIFVLWKPVEINIPHENGDIDDGK